MVTTTSSSSRNVNSAADSSLALLRADDGAAGVVGDAARDPQLFGVQPETDDVHRDRRVALLERLGLGAGVGTAGLETVGDQDDRVGHACPMRRGSRPPLARGRARWASTRRACSWRPARSTPPCRHPGPGRSGRTTDSSRADPAGVLLPLCPNTRNPTLISGRSAGIASITWSSTRLAASIRGSPVSVAAPIDPDESIINSTLTCVPGAVWARARCGPWTITPTPHSGSSSPTIVAGLIHVWARVVTRIPFLEGQAKSPGHRRPRTPTAGF